MRPAILLVLVLIPFFGAGHSSLSVWAATPNAMVLTLSDLGAKGSLGRRVSGTSAPGHPGIEVTMIVHLGMKTILSSFFEQVTAPSRRGPSSPLPLVLRPSASV